MTEFLLALVGAYGAGSIQIGGVLKRRPTKITRVASVYFDIAKGAIAVLAVTLVGYPSLAAVAALGVILGHMFPLHKRMDNCGIGVTLGAVAAFDPSVGLVALTSWIFVQYVFQHSIAAVFLSISTTIIASLIWVNPEQSGPVMALGSILFLRITSRLDTQLFATQLKEYLRDVRIGSV